MHPAVTHYLTRHAEPEATGSLEATPRQRGARRRYRDVVTVPCFDEQPDCLEPLLRVVTPQTLVIVVVNMPDNASPVAAHNTRSLLLELQRHAPANCMVIDRVTRPIPARQGVGLARKIGADIALACISAGIVERPWIYLTDADAAPPASYLERRGETAGTLLFPYRHRATDPDLQRRADLYELHMRYYVLALAQAGSTYAYPALGSTLCVHGRAYAKVRGVPRRNAGEDFYLLNKLAKVEPVTQLGGPPVVLAARLSDRVPFGTGPALAKVPDDAESYLSYAPATFQILSRVHAALARFAVGDPWRGPSQSAAWLDELGWQRCLSSARARAAGPQRQRLLREWFDAFRTLRFVHLARRRHPDQPLLGTLRARFPASKSADPASLLAQLRAK